MTQSPQRFASVLPGPTRSKSGRRIFLTVSAVVHVGVAVGFVAVGMWHMEKLEAGREELSLSVFMPPGNSGGGAAPRVAAAIVKKPQRQVVKILAQPSAKVERVITTEPAANEPLGDGGGGDGKGIGKPTSGSGCQQEPCGVSEVPVPLPPVDTLPVVAPVVVAPSIVPPSVVAGLRISGETQIEPPALVQTAISRDGATRVIGTFKICLNERGDVANVVTLKSTKYAGYDDEIKRTMRTWRYRPYFIGGSAAPVCSVVTFSYAQ